MFLTHRMDVTRLLKAEGQNELVVEFASALRRGRRLVEKHAHEHRFLARQTEPGRLPVRKAQYHWGWDSGSHPCDPYLESHRGRVADLWLHAEVSQDLATCDVQVFAQTEEANCGRDRVLLALRLEGTTVFSEECEIDAAGRSGTRFTLEAPRHPGFWYPRGYGDQARYELEATLLRESGDVVGSSSKMVGFRRAEPVQEPDAYGTSFQFRINNVDVGGKQPAYYRGRRGQYPLPSYQSRPEGRSGSRGTEKSWFNPTRRQMSCLG
ncbi:hypothetical protein SODALDRAFT_26498 [Sodiomyces alkalinus F11]|uniref:beta-mannosidase n=1 Tax=Sodiomyces alkalinus (strain CBS 110278 / VKM F-3762 / F11) TaxID=1314773 RepID=A0A3N2Q814_SODAK|nr:hypothetical protein SODALDRAFT_26498 [Sodiomyces alkalinus F11]ROT42913.1 hypothetical protein SODALDRAFT_26498 [Sodiomyces alkalinus F11]